MTKSTTRETIDISDQIDNLHIEKAIDLLKEWSAKHPNAWLDLTHEREYGDSIEKLYLHYDRDKTPLELEFDSLNEKCRLLQTLKQEAQAFKRNGTPYPRRDEALALAEELGFFALAPQQAMLCFHDDEIVVSDMMHTVRRRNGEFVMRMMRASVWLTDPEQKVAADSLDDMEDQRVQSLLDVSWID